MKNLITKKNIIIIAFIVIVIIIIGVIFTLKISKLEMNKHNSINTQYESIIKYYDKKEETYIKIADRQVINKNIEVLYDKGIAKVSMNGGNYIDYNGEQLEDGDYIFTITDNDEIIDRKEFKIDTTPPTILSPKQGKYTTEQYIELENLEDIKIAILTKGEEEIDLKKVLTKQGDKYKVADNGKYRIYVEDEYGNATYVDFLIKLK